jgi:hypothetical protein
MNMGTELGNIRAFFRTNVVEGGGAWWLKLIVGEFLRCCYGAWSKMKTIRVDEVKKAGGFG